ncbi:efflux RND transporter periplasmic adaptor subunit [Marinomonas sp. IMCC 4694]|uniref:efflux RND transporter periplasmic adaptor subunit n=1 Tax=Marinomonas sp. IMCC 4694 TaxID=2605432 RepID=UPI0011E85DDE|nr:HlyD family efflux transporter periplasmic adaptor subunit [Marinomonas sp. IMCC 4694]TYL48323.1 HlyD family efflux transporter periplasmic adaptor subunit [Marinomonas sp. IMCC 4694]
MSDQAISQLLKIEQQVRCCESATDLGFVMVNMTRTLVTYDQAVYLAGNELEKLKLSAVSDIALVDRTTPFGAWLEKVASHVNASELSATAHVMDTSAWPVSLSQDLKEFSPASMLWLPLLIPSKPNQRVGVMILAKSAPWSDKDKGLLQHLASTYGHALPLFYRRTGVKAWWRRVVSKKLQWATVTTLVLLAFVPVRLSVLAPADILAKDSVLVTSAIAGAVSDVLVKPGDLVAMNQPLVIMDKTEFQGAYDVAQRELERTQAELRTAEQAGYVDRRKKSELAELASQVELKTLDRDYLNVKLSQTQILAQKAGVAIIEDPEQWKGRPVVVGERILSIADPSNVQLQIMLPVADAISLQQGNEVTFYLDIDPLNPLIFRVNYSSFEPSLTPDQVVAYRIVADIEPGTAAPRIGLRGTAKLYGEEVSLAYYLLRRPITFVRQRLGL